MRMAQRRPTASANATRGKFSSVLRTDFRARRDVAGTRDPSHFVVVACEDVGAFAVLAEVEAHTLVVWRDAQAHDDFQHTQNDDRSDDALARSSR